VLASSRTHSTNEKATDDWGALDDQTEVTIPKCGMELPTTSTLELPRATRALEM
jgi:hypothetical protein